MEMIRQGRCSITVSSKYCKTTSDKGENNLNVWDISAAVFAAKDKMPVTSHV